MNNIQQIKSKGRLVLKIRRLEAKLVVNGTEGISSPKIIGRKLKGVVGKVSENFEEGIGTKRAGKIIQYKL